jgi:hypothetical protein
MHLTFHLMMTKRKWIHVATASILTLILSAATSLVFAQSEPSATNDSQHKSANRISFKGYLQGSEVDTLQGSPPDALSVDGRVAGIATHLGQFTLTYKANVKLPEGSSTGSGELVADNGDRIFISLVGQGNPSNPDTPTLNTIVEINTVTGGTGRFSGAIGSFTTKRLADVGTGFTSGSVQGTILFPHSPRRDH